MQEAKAQREASSALQMGKTPWSRKWQPTQARAWKIPWTEAPGRSRSIGPSTSPTWLSTHARQGLVLIFEQQTGERISSFTKRTPAKASVSSGPRSPPLLPFPPRHQAGRCVQGPSLYLHATWTLCDLMDYIVHGILHARILEWVAFPFSRGSS